MQSILANLGASGDSRDLKNRSLPTGDFMQMLSGMLGGQQGVHACMRACVQACVPLPGSLYLRGSSCLGLGWS